MIASIRGSLKLKMSESCIVEAGGLGYEIFLTQPALAALPSVGEMVEFSTYFHIREDAQQLFGFSSPEEKKLFLLLLTVKGVGPKLGMAVLSQLGPVALLSALKKRDLARLGTVSGVGKKLAERLGVELSDKVTKLGWLGLASPESEETFGESTQQNQALRALIALGYSSQNAKLALSKTYQQLGSGENKVEDIVKLALKFF
jgi:Holliday junction DNA helicase RuvA